MYLIQCLSLAFIHNNFLFDLKPILLAIKLCYTTLLDYVYYCFHCCAPT